MSGLRLETGQDKALKGAGGECVCVYVWNFGGVDMKSLQLRIAATKSEEEAGIDGGCVLKETWCKLPVLSRSKEEQIF